MRKLLNSLYITDETVWLALDGENIVCKGEEGEKFCMPFVNIEEIFCFSYLGCSPALMGKCADLGIALNFISPQGEFLARIQGKTRGNILLRKAQFEQFADPPILLAQKDDFYLIKRTKRPPLDKVNAMLSYLYTIMTSSYTSALESVGLDSCYGYYHALRSGRSSLACDLVEETRAVIERLVLTLINLKKVNAKDFEVQESGAVFLTRDGKKKVLTAWQEKRRSTILHPFLKEKIPFGLLPYVQSSLLAKYIRGELAEYPCFLQK